MSYFNLSLLKVILIKCLLCELPISIFKPEFSNLGLALMWVALRYRADNTFYISALNSTASTWYCLISTSSVLIIFMGRADELNYMYFCLMLNYFFQKFKRKFCCSFVSLGSCVQAGI